MFCYFHTHTQDLFASFLFGFFYLLADIAWAVGIAQLGTYISSTLTSCLNCPSVSPNVQTPLAAIASVVSWVGRRERGVFLYVSQLERWSSCFVLDVCVFLVREGVVCRCV